MSQGPKGSSDDAMAIPMHEPRMPLHVWRAISFFSCWTPATGNLIVCLGKRLCKWPTKRSVSIEMWTYRRVATFWTIFSFDCRIQAASTRVRRSGSWHRGPMCPSQRNSLEVRKPWTASTWLIYARLWHHSNSISTQLMVDNPSPK